MEIFTRNLESSYEEQREIPENVTMKCTSENAPVGWYHVCRAVDSNGNELAFSRCHYYNRTWESYTYQSVLRNCLSRLKEIEANGGKPVEVNTDLLDRLREDDLIYDYGYDEEEDLYVIFDTYSQYESCWSQLENLYNEDKLNPEWTLLVKKAYVGYTDEYTFCGNCGKVIRYDESTMTDWGYYCADCVNDDDDIVRQKIEEAQSNFRSAVTGEISESTIENLGYTLMGDFCARQFETGGYADVYFVQDLMDRYYGIFCYADSIGQFQSYFKIGVPDEYADEVQELIDRYEDGENPFEEAEDEEE